VVTAIAWAVWPDAAFGQIPFAAIHGTVSDPSDAVIGDATLIIREKETAMQRIVKTQHDGLYHVESLDPGDYEIEVSSPGFGAAVYGLSLRAGDHLTVNVRLEIGQFAETVTVNGPISGINTSDFRLSGGVSRFEMENLPLNGRN